MNCPQVETLLFLIEKVACPHFFPVPIYVPFLNLDVQTKCLGELFISPEKYQE
jgi:hypothetical protein